MDTGRKDYIDSWYRDICMHVITVYLNVTCMLLVCNVNTGHATCACGMCPSHNDNYHYSDYNRSNILTIYICCIIYIYIYIYIYILLHLPLNSRKMYVA